MNGKNKDILNKYMIGLQLFIKNLALSLVSCLRVCVLSSIRTARESKSYSELKSGTTCCILGNGPSLKDDFESGRVRTEGNDVFCVNMFCNSPLFKIIKPRFYFIIDNAYFAPHDERCQKLVDDLIISLNQVDWDINLIVSSSSFKGSRLLNSIVNKHIKVLRMNSTTVEGFKGFRHWLYRKRLGMPRCQTVVNFALCMAIDMGYKDVYLYGADHTWTRDLFVNEDNVVCYGDRHVYNKNITVIKKDGSFANLLVQFAQMFEAHYMLEEYSVAQHVKIWNCSSDSYLDAYERLKV